VTARVVVKSVSISLKSTFCKMSYSLAIMASELSFLHRGRLMTVFEQFQL